MRDVANGEREVTKAKKVPLGPALIWSSATLDAMARITERDIEQAKRMWRRLAPLKFRSLLDAKERADMESEERGNG